MQLGQLLKYKATVNIHYSFLLYDFPLYKLKSQAILKKTLKIWLLILWKLFNLPELRISLEILNSCITGMFIYLAVQETIRQFCGF